MTQDDVFSRPARLGSLVTGFSEEEITRLFTEKRVLVILEPSFEDIVDARETFIFTVNQILRFCPNVSVRVGENSQDLVIACRDWATEIHGTKATIELMSNLHREHFDATVNVGTEILAGLPGCTVNSTGWLARLATNRSGTEFLYWSKDRPNPLGALGAACRAAGVTFLTLLGKQFETSTEVSLFSHELGQPGALAGGPHLPDDSLALDAFLVGCGSVTSGWAYTVKRLPITGTLQAIDCQSLRKVNVGSYVSAGLSSIDKPKATFIREFLSPKIDVTARQDQWEFFKIWFRHGLTIPPLIIAGLDNVTTRHSVQRVWPETLIDMGAGGLESQVIVKHRESTGQCLLNALTIPPGKMEWAQTLANLTGLNPELIATDPTGGITQAEVDAAPVNQKPALKTLVGKPRCGYINRCTLEMEGFDPDFEPAAPFVTAFSGVIAAGETMKWLMGVRHENSLHYQMSFRSGLDRALQMKCNSECECQTRRS
jgi:hypothetical protein